MTDDGPGIDQELLDLLGRCVPAGAATATPLVSLHDRSRPNQETFAKLEGVSLGGSIKDRVALRLVRDGILSGRVTRGTTIIESSSGNTGVALAQIAAALGLKFIAVIDPKTTLTTRRLFDAFGAQVHYVEKPDQNGDYLPVRLEVVRAYLAGNREYWWPNQYDSESVIWAHVDGTMRELEQQLPKAPETIWCSASTCGTLLGCQRFIELREWDTELIAVDVIGSHVFENLSQGPRKFPGMGAAVRTRFAEEVQPTRVEVVSDDECSFGCIELARSYGLMVGASSGGVWRAYCRNLSNENRLGASVLIFPDRGERYLEGIFS